MGSKIDPTTGQLIAVGVTEQELAAELQRERGEIQTSLGQELQAAVQRVEGTASVATIASATLAAGSTGPVAVSLADPEFLGTETSIKGLLGTIYGVLARAAGGSYSFTSEQTYTGAVTLGAGTIFAAAHLPNSLNPLRIGTAELQEDQSYEGTGFAYVILDAAGRIGYGLKNDGTFDVSSGNINLDDAKIQEDFSFADGSGYARVEVDKNGRIAWGIKNDGTVEFERDSTLKGDLTVEQDSTLKGDLTVEQDSTLKGDLTVEQDSTLKGDLTVEQDSTFKGDLTVEGTLIGQTSSSSPIPIAMWGDSLTSTFGPFLSTETGNHIANYGVGGTASNAIIARTGATPVSLEPYTTSGGTIPASGALSITSQSPTINWRVWHYLAAPSPYVGGNIKGVFAGVVGYLRSNDPSSQTSTLTFTREVAGSAVTIPAGATFTAIPEDTVNGAIVDTNENYGQIFWTGTNDGGGLDDGSRFYPAIDVMTKKGKIIILPPLNGGLSYQAPGSTNWNRIINREAELRARFPTLFFDARRYLIENGKSWLSWYDNTAFQRDWGRSFNKIGTGTITARNAISSNDLNNGDIWQDSATSAYSVWDASTTSWLSDPTATPRNEQVDGNGDFIGLNSDYDVTNNQIPRALRDDTIHLNSYGNKMLAEALNLHIKSRYWYD